MKKGWRRSVKKETLGKWPNGSVWTFGCGGTRSTSSTIGMCPLTIHEIYQMSLLLTANLSSLCGMLLGKCYPRRNPSHPCQHTYRSRPLPSASQTHTMISSPPYSNHLRLDQTSGVPHHTLLAQNLHTLSVVAPKWGTDVFSTSSLAAA